MQAPRPRLAVLACVLLLASAPAGGAGRPVVENAAILARRGVPITFQSGFEDYVPRTHVVRFEAAVAGAWGLGFEAALRALTIDAARRLRVDDRVGSLERGKDADLVLYDGDPFEYTTHVEAVIVDGAVAWQREAP